MTGQSNNSQGSGHDRLPNWNPKNSGMLISQPVTSCLTNHSELCMSRPRNNQSRRISIYTLQRRPSFGFESSVSSTPMISGDPVFATIQNASISCRQRTRATRCIAANVLQTKVDAQYYELASELSWQCSGRSTFSSYSELFVDKSPILNCPTCIWRLR